MLSKYFKYKTKTKEFIENTEKILSDIKNKNVVIYGDVGNFSALNKKYKFKELFNVVAFISPDKRKKLPKKYGIKNLKENELEKDMFDSVLITVENNPELIFNDLKSEFGDDTDVKIMFSEKILDTAINLDYLLKYNFEKNLPKIIKKLKGKRVLFYGSGLFFKLINEYYDLSSLNAIGVVDKQFSQLDDCDEVCGYKLYNPEQILELNPDYILITTKRIIPIADILYSKYLKNTDIKIMPLVKKGFWATIKEG